MKTTERINIGGFSFTIEKDAFASLDKYLKEIAKTYNGDNSSEEIISAIEERIAELIMEKSGKDAVVTLETVEMVKGRIGDPSQLAEDEASMSAGQEKADEKSRKERQPRRLYRDPDHRMFGGVCSGLAAYFNIDVVFPRLAFVLLFILGCVIDNVLIDKNFFFIAVLAYFVLWLVVPAARTVEEKCNMNGKPLNLEEFSTKAASTFKEVGEEVRTSSGLRTFGKIVCIIVGIFLLLGGLSGLGVGLFVGFASNLPELILKKWDLAESFGQIDVLTLVSDKIFYLLIAGIISLTSIIMIYLGTLLTFSLRSPRWRPGIILFILWFVAVLFLAAYIVKKAILFAI